MSSDLLHHHLPLADGGTLDLAELRGKAILVVNTASGCGFTPQYEGLQELHEEYGDRGLVVIACPSADFNQEKLEGSELGEFCSTKYRVTFPVTDRISVKKNPDGFWQDLLEQPGAKAPRWNFAKYLIGPDGRFVVRFGTTTKPTSKKVRARIEQILPR